MAFPNFGTKLARAAGMVLQCSVLQHAPARCFEPRTVIVEAAPPPSHAGEQMTQPQPKLTAAVPPFGVFQRANARCFELCSVAIAAASPPAHAAEQMTWQQRRGTAKLTAVMPFGAKLARAAQIVLRRSVFERAPACCSELRTVGLEAAPPLALAEKHTRRHEMFTPRCVAASTVTRIPHDPAVLPGGCNGLVPLASGGLESLWHHHRFREPATTPLFLLSARPGHHAPILIALRRRAIGAAAALCRPDAPPVASAYSTFLVINAPGGISVWPAKYLTMDPLVGSMLDYPVLDSRARGAVVRRDAFRFTELEPEPASPAPVAGRARHEGAIQSGGGATGSDRSKSVGVLLLTLTTTSSARADDSARATDRAALEAAPAALARAAARTASSWTQGADESERRLVFAALSPSEGARLESAPSTSPRARCDGASGAPAGWLAELDRPHDVTLPTERALSPTHWCATPSEVHYDAIILPPPSAKLLARLPLSPMLPRDGADWAMLTLLTVAELRELATDGGDEGDDDKRDAQHAAPDAELALVALASHSYRALALVAHRRGDGARALRAMVWSLKLRCQLARAGLRAGELRELAEHTAELATLLVETAGTPRLLTRSVVASGLALAERNLALATARAPDDAAADARRAVDTLCALACCQLAEGSLAAAHAALATLERGLAAAAAQPPAPAAARCARVRALRLAGLVHLRLGDAGACAAACAAARGLDASRVPPPRGCLLELLLGLRIAQVGAALCGSELVDATPPPALQALQAVHSPSERALASAVDEARVNERHCVRLLAALADATDALAPAALRAAAECAAFVANQQGCARAVSHPWLVEWTCAVLDLLHDAWARDQAAGTASRAARAPAFGGGAAANMLRRARAMLARGGRGGEPRGGARDYEGAFDALSARLLAALERCGRVAGGCEAVLHLQRGRRRALLGARARARNAWAACACVAALGGRKWELVRAQLLLDHEDATAPVTGACQL